LASDEAEDLNEDGEIDEADYELLLEFVFGGPDGPGGPGPFVPEFEDWLASDEAEDLNEDGEIDEADYELLLEFVFGGPDGPGGPGPFVPEFEDWLASDEAEDLNEDGEIDESDYDIFVEILFVEGPGGPGPDPLFELLDRLASEFDDNPRMLIDPLDFLEELDDPGAVDFLLRLQVLTDSYLEKRSCLSWRMGLPMAKVIFLA